MAQAAPEDDRDILVFLSTTAHHKLRIYREIAKQKNLRIHLFNIDVLYRAVAQTDELNGSTEGNANEKSNSLRDSIEKLSMEEKILMGAKVKEIIKRLKLDNPRILFATDDASLKLPSKIWSKLDKAGTNDVLEHFKAEAGPGPEFGPFVNAIGGLEELLRRIKQVENGDTVVFEDEVTLAFQWAKLKIEDGHSLVELSEKLRKITADTSAVAALKVQKNKRKHASPISPRTTMDGSKLNIDQLGEVPFSEHLLHQTVRGKVVSGMTHWHVKKGMPALINPKLPTDLKIAVLGEKNSKAAFLRGAGLERLVGSPSDFVADAKVDDLINGHDGFVIFDNKTKLSAEQELSLLYVLNSLIVAKQTDGRDSQKPIILVDLVKGGGTLTKAARLHKVMAGAGFIKEGEFSRKIETSGCRAYANNYFILIQAADVTQAKDVIKKILPNEMENYIRPDFPEIEDVVISNSSAKIKESKHTIAILGSASNQNDELEKDSYEIAEFIASLGFNLSYGAMDKYMGEEIIKGFKHGQNDFRSHNKEADQPVLIGVSTPILKKRETREGKFNSDIDITFTTPNLSKRTKKILKPVGNKEVDIVTLLPGGAGTIVEVVKQVIDNKHRFEPIPIIVYNPSFPTNTNRYMERLLKGMATAIFEGKEPDAEKKIEMLNVKSGSDKAQKVRRTTGIYVVNTVREYKAVLLQLCVERGIDISSVETNAVGAVK